MTELLPAILEPAPTGVAAALPDVVEAFLRAAKPATHRARDGDLRDFARFAGAGVRQAVRAMLLLGHGRANQLAHAYRCHLEARRLAPATVARRLASLRAVVALARTWGEVDWALDVSSPKAECYRDTRGPGDDGWEAVRRLAAAQAATGEPRAVRNRAILLVSHDLGLRVAELAGLDLEHVERDARGLPSAVWIEGKGRVSRERLTVPVGAAEALSCWLYHRGSDPGPVFYRLDRGAAQQRTTDNGRLTTRSIERMALAVGKRAGLPRPLTPHQFRHHAITRALDKTGGDVRRVRAFSRHKRVETLMRYDDNRRDDAGAIAALVGGD